MKQATAITDRLEQVLLAIDAESTGGPSPLLEFARLLLGRASQDFLEGASPEETALEVRRLFELLEGTGSHGISVRVRSLGGAHRSVLETVMPDCSFIVNTLREYVHSLDLDIPHLLHPVMAVRRGGDRKVVGVETPSTGGLKTSTVYMVVEGPLDEEMRASLQEEVAERLERVIAVNNDFEAMLARSSETITELEQEKGGRTVALG